MVANDRPGASAPLAPTAPTATPQTASFTVASFHLELTAGRGSVTLSVALDGDRDSYVLEPGALGAWADWTARLLELQPAATATERAAFRAPFLLDIEGRPAVAFECAVAEAGVGYRMLVAGAQGRVGSVPADASAVRTMVEAARGAAATACPSAGGSQDG